MSPYCSIVSEPEWENLSIEELEKIPEYVRRHYSSAACLHYNYTWKYPDSFSKELTQRVKEETEYYYKLCEDLGLFNLEK